MSESDAENIAEWLRSRPVAVQNLARQFPPFCRVQATRPLACPAPGQAGEVASYLETGTVTVECDGVSFRAECQPEWLEIVGYTEPFTPEWVEAVLGGKGVAT